MSDIYEDMSKNELIDAIELLQQELEETSNELKEIHEKNILLQRKLNLNDLNSDDNDKDSLEVNNVLNSVALETENEELREKLNKLQNDNNILKENNLELNSHIKVLQSEKIEIDVDIRNLRKKIDELEKSLAESEEKNRSSVRKSQDINKQKKDTQKQQLQLYDENETLQKEVNYLLLFDYYYYYYLILLLHINLTINIYRIKNYKNKIQHGQQIQKYLKN